MNETGSKGHYFATKKRRRKNGPGSKAVGDISMLLETGTIDVKYLQSLLT